MVFRLAFARGNSRHLTRHLRGYTLLRYGEGNDQGGRLALRPVCARMGAALERHTDHLPLVQVALLEQAAPITKGEAVSITYVGRIYTVTTEQELLTLVAVLNRKAA